MNAWPFPDVHVSLSGSSPALVLVDMQYFDADSETGFGLAMRNLAPHLARHYLDRLATEVIPNQRRLLDAFHARGLPVLYVIYASALADGADLNPAARARSEARRRLTGQPTIYPLGTREAEVLDALRPTPADLVLRKTSIGAFNSSPIDRVLRNLGVDRVVLAGVTTDACVETTARDAADRGYGTIVVADACVTWEAEAHAASLRAFGRYFGRVATTSEVLCELPDRPLSAC